MKAITVDPLSAWVLMEGLVSIIPYERRTLYRGEMLIGAGQLTLKTIEAYMSWWWINNGVHPVQWSTVVPQRAYVALARLVDVVAYDGTLLKVGDSTFNGLLSIKKWMLVFEDAQRLAQPVFCQQESGIRDYDLSNLKPVRYNPLTKEQVDDLFGLCQHLEAVGNQGADQAVADHFITLPAHEKLRRKLFKRHHGYYLLRRLRWRKAFKKAFPEYGSEGS